LIKKAPGFGLGLFYVGEILNKYRSIRISYMLCSIRQGL